MSDSESIAVALSLAALLSGASLVLLNIRLLRMLGLSLVAAFVAISFPREAGCFPWSVDMFRSPWVGPQRRTPRNQPSGTLSENGTEPMSLEAASASLHNPLSPTPELLGKGKLLFDITCFPCHGNGAEGDGPARSILRVPPADLTAGNPVTLSDGYIYSTIRNGNEAMPAYGDTLSSRETWELILYVRDLQHRAQTNAANR